MTVMRSGKHQPHGLILLLCVNRCPEEFASLHDPVYHLLCCRPHGLHIPTLYHGKGKPVLPLGRLHAGVLWVSGSGGKTLAYVQEDLSGAFYPVPGYLSRLTLWNFLIPFSTLAKNLRLLLRLRIPSASLFTNLCSWHVLCGLGHTFVLDIWRRQEDGDPEKDLSTVMVYTVIVALDLLLFFPVPMVGVEWGTFL